MRTTKIFHITIVLIFAMTQILPAGYVYASSSNDSRLDRFNRGMTESYAPRYIQQATLGANQALTTDNINRKKAVEEQSTDNLKRPIDKPKEETVQLKHPQEGSSGGGETKVTAVTYTTGGGNGGSGGGPGGTTGPNIPLPDNLPEGTTIIVHRADGTIVTPAGPSEEGTNEQGRHYRRTYDDLGRLTSEFIEDRGTVLYEYNDTTNTVTATTDFTASPDLPAGFTTGGANNWIITNGQAFGGDLSIGSESWIQYNVDLTNKNEGSFAYLTYNGYFTGMLGIEMYVTILDSQDNIISGPTAVVLLSEGFNMITLGGGQSYKIRWSLKNNGPYVHGYATLDNIAVRHNGVVIKQEEFNPTVSFTSANGAWRLLKMGDDYVYTQITSFDQPWTTTFMDNAQAGPGSHIETSFKFADSLMPTPKAAIIFGSDGNWAYMAVAGNNGGFAQGYISLLAIDLQAGITFEIATTSMPSVFDALNWYTLSVDLSAGAADILLDGVSRLHVSGLDLFGQGIGLAASDDPAWEERVADFRDFNVTKPSDYTLEYVRPHVPNTPVIPTNPLPRPTVPTTDDTDIIQTTSQEPPIAGQRPYASDRLRFITPEDYIASGFRHGLRTNLGSPTDYSGIYDQRRTPRDYGRELRDTLSQWIPLTALVRKIKTEESLQGFIRMLVNKPNRTNAENQMIEVMGAVMADSNNIPEETMIAFEDAMKRVRVAQRMEGAISARDMKQITDALTALAGKQRDLYGGYLSRTEAAYKELEKLLGIDIENQDIPDEYVTIANTSEGKRKILVDLALLSLQSKAKSELTASQRKALSINETILKPLREEYAQKIATAINKFVNSIKETLRNISGSGAVINETDINNINSLKAIFMLDKGVM